jgi:hypothetical protein
MKNPRLYNVSDVDMILAADTIVGHAIANKVFLQTKRSTWADPFFEDFSTRIDNAISTYLGADNARELRNATQKVNDTLAPVQELLSEVKVQIEEDYRDNPERRREILNTLGFKGSSRDILTGDQGAAIEFLYQFKSNLTEELMTELIGKGIMKESLVALCDHAEKLKNADVAQEMSKGSRKLMTAEAVAEFNAVYVQVVSMSKIAVKFLKGNKAGQELFSFSKTSKAQRSSRKQQPVAS